MTTKIEVYNIYNKDLEKRYKDEIIDWYGEHGSNELFGIQIVKNKNIIDKVKLEKYLEKNDLEDICYIPEEFCEYYIRLLNGFLENGSINAIEESEITLDFNYAKDLVKPLILIRSEREI